jgi:hypothetical protein
MTARVAGATARVLGLAATPWPYAAWLAISAAWLVVAGHVDPYVLGFSSFATAAVSGVLALVALIRSPRHLPLALVGALPTAVAFYVLGTYNWA